VRGKPVAEEGGFCRKSMTRDTHARDYSPAECLLVDEGREEGLCEGDVVCLVVQPSYVVIVGDASSVGGVVV
jgi:hypothetical protein